MWRDNLPLSASSSKWSPDAAVSPYPQRLNRPSLCGQHESPMQDDEDYEPGEFFSD